MSTITEKDIIGLRASLKYETKKKNPYKKCRPITKKSIKDAVFDGTLATIQMNCPKMEGNQGMVMNLFSSKILSFLPRILSSQGHILKPCKVRFDARGRNCPTYDSITVTSPVLVCDEGYRAEGDTCVDIDECEETGCQGIAQCTNLPGSYVCDCDGYGDGYSVSKLKNF